MCKLGWEKRGLLITKMGDFKIKGTVISREVAGGLSMCLDNWLMHKPM